MVTYLGKIPMMSAHRLISQFTPLERVGGGDLGPLFTQKYAPAGAMRGIMYSGQWTVWGKNGRRPM